MKKKLDLIKSFIDQKLSTNPAVLSPIATFDAKQLDKFKDFDERILKFFH